MKVFIVYCHPSDDSFTYNVKEEFIKGLIESGHSYKVADLYRMAFNPVFSKGEYDREAFYDENVYVPDDVIQQQMLINESDVIVFIYPVFWTEAPAMLVGWFQRVLTYGFAYEPTTMKELEKALFLVTMGGDRNDAVRKEQIKAMHTVMIGDRMNNRVKNSKMIIFDRMTRGYDNKENREQKAVEFLKKVYKIAVDL